MQAYSDAQRADMPYSLPDIEVFEGDQYSGDFDAEYSLEPGWYWWSCFPGCLPDSEPMGPYDSELEALQAAQDW